MPGFDDPPQQPSDGGWAMRNLESNLQACQTRLDNYDRLFAGYTELMLSAFDEGYQPTQYSMLMKRGGGWPGIVGSMEAVPPLNPGSDVSTNSDPLVTIVYGTYGGAVPTISGTPLSVTLASNVITLSPTDEVVYMQCDFTYDSSGDVTIVDAEIMSATLASFEGLSSGAGGGSGIVYQILFGVAITAPVGMGPYAVATAPAVGGSQNFNLCLGGPSISGPFGV